MRDTAVPVQIHDALIVTRSLDINEVTAPTIVSTSAPVVPEVVNLLSELSLCSLTSDGHSQLHPNERILSIVVILSVLYSTISHVCVSLSVSLSLEADPTSNSNSLVSSLTLSQVLNFRRSQIPVELVVSLTVSIRIVANNTESLILKCVRRL